MFRILKAIIGIDDDDRNPSTSGEIVNKGSNQEFHGTNNNTGYMKGNNNGKVRGSSHSSKDGGNKPQN
ncbi:hypothetical protein O6P43_021841 [Quillaja saponaria]|uniref:Uncharacterized protein n=1 Tax=Quillaja saponaria TaxID=32244 RepID=A0AAD7PHE8_QUISA|nr:hypothetical protein O6P43_021841 [Quillaja saponaria]